MYFLMLIHRYSIYTVQFKIYWHSYMLLYYYEISGKMKIINYCSYISLRLLHFLVYDGKLFRNYLDDTHFLDIMLLYFNLFHI